MDRAKKVAAIAAVNQTITKNTQIIGIGSGTTIEFAVERIAEIAPTLSLKACIPTSYQAQELILKHGLPLVLLIINL